VFIVAVTAAALGYGVMNLLMAATPIAMQQCSHPFSSAALVLEWHVLGMFVPSFFTGHLIRRFGALPVMGVGVLLNVVCVLVALSGRGPDAVPGGAGRAGRGLELPVHRRHDAADADLPPGGEEQGSGAMDTCVFSTMMVSSFASGALITTQGWTWLNLGSLVPLTAVAGALTWLALRQRAAPRVA
jgi:hypothetical protein